MQCDKVCERTLVAASDSCAMNAGRQKLSHALYAGSRLPQFVLAGSRQRRMFQVRRDFGGPQPARGACAKR